MQQDNYISLIVLLVLFIIYLICKINRFNIEKEKKEYVCEIIHGHWQFDHYHKNYNFAYLEMLQGCLKVADSYKFRKDDEKQVMKIFEEFKKNMSEKYFSNRIGLPKTKYLISNDDFLMYHLYLFLNDKYYSIFFCDEPMHKEKVSYKINDCGETDSTYSVTEFAIVVFKLLYIAYMYCKNSKTLNSKGENFMNEKWIEELIDTKTIRILCYRP